MLPLKPDIAAHAFRRQRPLEHMESLRGLGLEAETMASAVSELFCANSIRASAGSSGAQSAAGTKAKDIKFAALNPLICGTVSAIKRYSCQAA
ncbi:hypothetical protein B0E45_01305 [Sinorhizobium sp. A49]|nr:hypothetical protein B0E45_01305 [Sinorhizobium sp. A49]